ncbi:MULTISPECIES: hypothetical protein [Bacillus]|uniref:hypothetical protein n=1 Tax=Bacillus TaxID=1386 RepID=UPI000A4EF7DC|nr:MULTISPECIES: hypothetical protein [Bacillus]MBU8739738.1 hypothetical protein [Bacillus licheniformis]MEC0494332.1 hypothetical protein [Bacillus glycinifermentans]MEC0540747.1 hypothetical protein [Bacillus glycinifermentans]
MGEYVYLLWDYTDDFGSNGKVTLHSVHDTEASALKEKRKQPREGEFFFIREEQLRKD